MDLLLGLALDGPLFGWLTTLLQAEWTKMTFAFLLAAEVHKRAMRKELTLLRQSIDHVADVMGKRIDGLDRRVERLEVRD